MITSDNTLLCIFSFNMGKALQNCIQSVRKMCSDFDVVLMDDASTDPETVGIIDANRDAFRDVFVSTESKLGRLHGNLYRNIQKMIDYAADKGYKYIFLIQDDMQFVRHFDVKVRTQYSNIFSGDQSVAQIDPRFIRRKTSCEILDNIRAYRYNPSMSYSDVGIIDINRFRSFGWTLKEGEGVNKTALSRLGYYRVYPYSPIIMHVPFPAIFRNGKKRFTILPANRGQYSFQDMSEDEVKATDSRPLEHLPYFRDFLKPKGSWLASFLYNCFSDKKIFR